MKKLDKSLIFSTTGIVLALMVFITLFNDVFVNTTNYVNSILTERLGWYYILLGVVSILVLLGISLSKYGKVKIGSKDDKPAHSTFAWAAMIFTSTMAADIVFFSLHEWVYYYQDYHNTYLSSQSALSAASTYPLFHWGAIPWSFYLLPAVSYAYIKYNKNRDCNKLSQACYPTVKNNLIIRFIDILGVVGLIVAVSTTFSLATPLMANALSFITGVEYSSGLVIGILVVVGIIYGLATILGIKGISAVAKVCYCSFGLLVVTMLFCGYPSSVFSSGVESIGNMVQNFLGMSTFMSESSFTKDWTIFYWAYWIAWSIATPFFIAEISKGRTVRSVLLGGLASGLSGTFASFIVLGNTTMYFAMSKPDIIDKFINGAISESQFIMNIIKSIPGSVVIIPLLFITMVLLYASTLDSIVHTISRYSYRKLGLTDDSSKYVKVFWSLLFLILPISLIYFNNTMETLKTLSIILAFPMSFIMITIVYNFIKTIRSDYK